MWRVVVGTFFLALLAPAHGRAAADCLPADVAVLDRFFAIDPAGPAQYKALRHLEASNERYNKSAWMDVWTEADRAGFRYEVVGDGGSSFIQSRVFMPALNAERDMWSSGVIERARFTPENYTFAQCQAGGDVPGLARISVKPRRKDILLVEGAIFLRPEDADLVRVQGVLSKTPSFWTRRVEVVRHYERIGGVHLPVALESVANVLFAGTSTFKMTYAYETVNGASVGSPSVASSDR